MNSEQSLHEEADEELRKLLKNSNEELEQLHDQLETQRLELEEQLKLLENERFEVRYFAEAIRHARENKDYTVLSILQSKLNELNVKNINMRLLKDCVSLKTEIAHLESRIKFLQEHQPHKSPEFTWYSDDSEDDASAASAPDDDDDDGGMFDSSDDDLNWDLAPPELRRHPAARFRAGGSNHKIATKIKYTKRD